MASACVEIQWLAVTKKFCWDVELINVPVQLKSPVPLAKVMRATDRRRSNSHIECGVVRHTPHRGYKSTGSKINSRLRHPCRH